MNPLSERPAGATPRSEPEDFRGRRLSVSLTVDDLQASLAWYRDVVGWHVVREMNDEGQVPRAVLLAGNVEIMLNQDDGAKGWDRNKGVGLSLRITTVQDLDQLAGRIRKRGGELLLEPTDMPWGERIFRLRDPDGFTYTIIAGSGD